MEQPARFKITWLSEKAEYRVNIPRYAGGEVVRAEFVDRLHDLVLSLPIDISKHPALAAALDEIGGGDE